MNIDKISCLVFDLDDTLYPHSSGVWLKIRDRITRYLQDVMGFPETEVDALRSRLWSQYGTTLRGLQAEYEVDMTEYLAYVHDIPLEHFLAPDPTLDHILSQLPWRKVIFTNSDTNHANQVLSQLGINRHFERIVDIHAIAPYCKPQTAAFDKALPLIGDEPGRCLLVDDSPANLDTARSLGMQTVSVGERNHDGSPHIETVHGLYDLLVGQHN